MFKWVLRVKTILFFFNSEIQVPMSAYAKILQKWETAMNRVWMAWWEFRMACVYSMSGGSMIVKWGFHHKVSRRVWVPPPPVSEVDVGRLLLVASESLGHTVLY